MKIEYSDLYRFLVSLGVALIALAFIIPWLFLREPFDLLITKESLDELTPLAKDIVEHRQEYLASLLAIIPCTSVFLVVAGVVLSIIGIAQWWTKTQRLSDRKQQLELWAAEQALRPATQADIQAKLQGDLLEELEDVSPPDVQAFTASASQVEKRVAEILQDCYPDVHKLLKNQKIGHAVFDFLLLSRMLPPGKHRNYTIEVKYIRKGFRFGWLRDNLTKVIYLSDIFENETGLPSFPVLLVVGKGDVLSAIRSRQYVDRLRPELKSLEADASVVFMDESELDEMRCEQLMALFEAGSIRD